MSRLTIVVLLLCFVSEAVSLAQTTKDNTFDLYGIVIDGQDKQPLSYVTVRLMRKDKLVGGTTTDNNGKFALKVVPGDELHLQAMLLGYEPLDTVVHISRNTYLVLELSSDIQTVNEVVVTAKEKKGMTSTSIIGQTAMEHLQPSSFTDLLSLLPGGMTNLPQMGSANVISLREVGISSSDYATSSLGTKFVIDGQTIGTDANMQYIAGAYQGDEDTYRNHVSYGVDMRQIPTDNIEKVEIVRGIPSVKYGDLTSGLVNITRKHRSTPFQARFKADEYGKLFSAGKGFEFSREWSLNIDGGLLMSKTDPRNKFETYNRLTLSARAQKVWHYDNERFLKWNVITDYAANIDNVKTDPEVQVNPDDRYKSSYSKFGLNNKLTFDNGKEKTLKSVMISYAMSIAADKIHQVEYISLDRDYTVPMVYETGEYDGIFLPYKYVSDYKVEGLPFYSTLKGEAELGVNTWNIDHNITFGAEWQLNKNYGRGQIFDLSKPLHASTARRPRRYKDIPATSILSCYAEEYATLSAGKHKLSLMMGIRASRLLNIGREYVMHGKTYFDPRVNMQWDFPSIGGLNIYLSGGIGRMTKMPTMNDIYPDYVYKDITQMSYWDTNPAFKRINIRTYKIDRTNHELRPAHNTKWEIRVGADYKNHNFYMTYFNEDMKSGFRSTLEVRPFVFKRYDTSTINPHTLTAPPALEDMTFVNDTVLGGYGKTSNGSRIMKEGIEFQYSSPRIKYINTRITVNGAWFHTIYENSHPEYNTNSLAIIGNTQVNDKYIGYYDTTDKYDRHQFTSNFIADTYLDRLGMILSATAECYWLGKYNRPATSTVPLGYMDVSGELKPYTEADKTDTFKSWLILKGTAGQNMNSKERFYMLVNFKATKKFGKHLILSFFADRFLSIAPDYEVNGFVMRRSFSPYFGMELNVKI